MGITEAPHRDANTSRDVETRPDHVHILLGLHLESGGVGREVLDADVELGVGDVEAESCVFIECPGEVLAGGGASDCHVRLEPDAVDGDAGGLHELDDADGTVGFDGEVFEVVWGMLAMVFTGFQVVHTIIVVELGAGVCSRSKLEGQGEVAVTERLQEGVVAIGTVVLEGLVYNIPGIAFALEMAHDVGNVRLHDGSHAVLRPRSRRYPSWQLAVPHQRVAAHEHLVADSPVNDGVGRSVRKPTTRGLGGVPFLRIVGRVLAEVLDIVGELVVRRVAAIAGAHRRAEVEESGIFGERVELAKHYKGACHEARENRDLHLG